VQVRPAVYKHSSELAKLFDEIRPKINVNSPGISNRISSQHISLRIVQKGLSPGSGWFVTCEINTFELGPKYMFQYHFHAAS
jgi:hypothetical protein